MSRSQLETVNKVFGLDDSKETENAKRQKKVNEMYGMAEKAPHIKEYNPFLNKNGELFNPYINYQKVLDNPNVTQKAKRFITQATGLSPTPEPIQSTPDKTVSPAFSPKTSGKFGFISAKYETGGYDGGLVSSGTGDYGGVSYGIPQFSTVTGSADKFVNWLKQSNPEMGKYFGNAKAGTTEFSNAWKRVYSDYGDEFSNIQTSYAYNNFVQPLADIAKKETGIDYTRSDALRELLYSTAIQFGSGSLGLSALGNVSADMSDTDIINASYDKKIANYKNFFKDSSAAVQESVKNRFANERNDVLALVGSGTGKNAIAGGSNLSGTVGKKVADTQKYSNDAAYGQCVWYVRGRMKEKLGKDWGAIGNANEVWYNAPEQSRLRAAAENIKPNTVASYKVGSSGSKYGHVIYIEAVSGDDVYFTEGGSGYHKNGTDGVIKKTTKQQILNGTGGFGSGLIGLIDITKI